MNILILNWRDLKNPNAGGAEILTHEMAKEWVKKGHNVTQISSFFKGAKKRDTIDGVRIIRFGQWWSVQFLSCFYYFFVLRPRIDYIIDEVHWFPFFSALYAPRKTTALICEVASKLFFKILPFPLALFFLGLEKIYLKIYRNFPSITISPSSYHDLINSGFLPEKTKIIPMGISIPKNMTKKNKEKKPTLINIGRMNLLKGTFDVLDAFRLLKKDLPDASLWLVGSAEGKFLQMIKDKIQKYNLFNSVRVFGKVTEQKKFELLSRAHLLISASVQEGWGLTVPEAGIVMTPAVVYNSHGFRDIISNKFNGILVNPRPEALASAIISLINNKADYALMQKNAVIEASKYSWTNTASEALKFIQEQ